MKNIKDRTWYQILFVPKKGKMFTLMVWAFIVGLLIIALS